MKAKFHYGLESIDQAREIARRTIVILGNGKHQSAQAMILETACAETQLGQYPDSYEPEGFGLHQFDTIGLNDTITRTRELDKLRVFNAFGFDLEKVTPQSISNDPVQSFVLCRLKYKLRPEEIPADFVSRAVYWKRFYNTEAGKGTVDHYLESAERILYTNHTNPTR